MGVSISKSDSMILNAQHVFLYFNNPIKTSIETVKAELTQLVENTGAPNHPRSKLLHCNRLRQISWLVNVAPAQHSYVVG
jgi:hypothetical protein